MHSVSKPEGNQLKTAIRVEKSSFDNFCFSVNKHKQHSELKRERKCCYERKKYLKTERKE